MQHIAPPAGIPPIYNRQIVGDTGHLLYVSFTRNGLWRFVDGAWSKVTAIGMPDLTPTALLLDTRKRLWVAYLDGSIAMLDGGVASTFKENPGPSLGLIEVFLESKFGLLVGGTNGIAILRGDHLQRLLSADQVAMRGVSGFLQASNGDLWVNGMHGIVRIPSSEVTQAIGSPDYQMHSELIAEAGIVGPSPQLLRIPTAVMDVEGIFWFSTSNTVVTVDPNSIHPNTTAPILSGISTTVDGFALAANHQVPPGYHTIRIKYLGAYITAPEKVTYRYKLDHADKTWRRSATVRKRCTPD
jgi:hypothetical protein